MDDETNTNKDAIMARCTAPVNGHSSSSAAAKCPACRYRYGGGYGGHSGHSGYSPSYSYSSSSSGGGSSATSKNRRPRWSGETSTLIYSDAQVKALTPIRDEVERLASKSDLRDVFLCHAWDDRKEAAKDLHDLLEAAGVKVWFSEKDIGLGVPFLRAIDKGLANSRVGIVLVTPALLKRLPNEGVADKELSALLASDRLVPIVHETTYDELRDVSPLLASRNGFDTAEESMGEVALKIAELVAI